MRYSEINDAESFIASLPRKTVKAGTVLWHGTDSNKDFVIPRGPAWFAFSETVATKWIGWASPRNGETRGARRILKMKLTKDVNLLLFSRKSFERLGLFFFDDPEPIIYPLALKLTEYGEGWVSGTKGVLGEIMLPDPHDTLEAIAIIKAGQSSQN